jgi:predicted ATPase
VHARDLDAHASELAYHYGEAQTLPANDKFVHYALRAGERALESDAFEEAAAHCERGLDAISGRSMNEEQAALLSGLRRAQAVLLPHLLAASGLSMRNG